MIAACRDLWSRRELAWILITKELKLRYRRSVLGFAWTMLNPLMMMLILTVVFSHVWRVQVDAFPVFVLSALLPWIFFSQSISGGAYSIIHNESLLRNIRLPRAVFPIALVGSQLVNLLLALVPLALVMAWQGVPLRPAIALLPYCMLCLFSFTLGVVLVLSAWTVFFRDVGQIVEVSLTGLFYLTPIIYPPEILPDRYVWILKLNPMYYEIVPFREIFLEGRVPSPDLLLAAGGLGLVSLAIGFLEFRRREDQFLHYLS